MKRRNENVTTPVTASSEVARRIRQHARAHMKAEVCGVLIGGLKDGVLHIEECIAGEDAAQAGTHVTFTQDTWEHIYKVKDAEFPNERIVGWYHSHPGFGIFLSDHDTFIHRNFFSAREQVAWVYDPHSDEEGFFGWAGERIERLGLVSFADSRGGEECTENHGAMKSAASEDEEDDSLIVSRSRDTKREESAVMRWVGAIITHVLAVALGMLVAWYIFPRILVLPVDPRTGNPLISMPADTSTSPSSQAPAASSPSTTSPSASQPPEQQKKGDNAQPK